MSELKVYSDYAELLAAAKAADIKETKLDKAIENYGLTNGKVKFTAIEVVSGAMAHIRMHTKAGEMISIANLLTSAAFVASVTEIKGTQASNEEKKESYNKWFVKGTRLNPSFVNDQAKLAMFLMGKTFVSEQISGFIVPYKEDKTTQKPIFAELESDLAKNAIVKTFHKLTPVLED